MHPDLWTVPGIDFTIRSYGFFIAAGFLLALWIAVRRAPRAGCDPRTITTIAILGLGLGMVGCRGMHVLHHFWEQIRSGKMSLKDVALMPGGGEILGGVILAVVGVMGYLLITRKRVMPHLDVTFPPMILAMGIGRIGCLMFGCCWGGVCATDAGDKGLPWAMRFPYGSPPYLRQMEQGDLEAPEELTWKLPQAETILPIPMAVLEKFDIDGDPLLSDWATAQHEHRQAKNRAPDSPDVAAWAERLEAAQAALHDREKFDLFTQLAAARHLHQLNQRPDHAPVTWADLRQMARNEHSLWVHPAQMYDAVALLLLFFVLSAVFYRQKHVGMVVAWGMVLYPINRILQELIRSDNPHDTFGLTISQFISMAVFAIGVVMVIVLAKRPASPQYQKTAPPTA